MRQPETQAGTSQGEGRLRSITLRTNSENQMKKLILGALSLTIVAASNAYGQGANSASATANAKARIVNQITLAVAGTSELNFGDVVPSTVTLGTVSLTPAGIRAAAGGVTLGSSTAVGVPTFN